MQDGFVKVAARTPEVRVADVDFNTKAILEEVRRAREDDDAKLVVLPELCVTTRHRHHRARDGRLRPAALLRRAGPCER